MFVLERGGKLPASVPPRALRTKRVVVTQQPAESAHELLVRTAAQLSELDGRGREIGFALLACGESEEDGAGAARAELTDVILGHMRGATCARLVLTAQERANAQLRWDLVSLADHAISVLAGGGGSVSIRFGETC